MPLTLTVMHGNAVAQDLSVSTSHSPKMVGRGAQNEIRVEDPYVSDVHAAFYFDAQGARVRDLGSQHGTWVNDQNVSDRSLAEGDRVQIGQTMFLVSVRPDEAAAAAVSDPAIDALVRAFHTTPRDCARFAMRAERDPLFALVDLADAPDMVELLNEAGEEFAAFDESVEPDALGDAAPCLVSFSRGSLLLGRVLEETWGQDRAVFFTSGAPFSDVFSHWLQWIELDEDGNVVSPRVWQPSVLTEVLQGHGEEESRAFAGPVSAFLTESPDAEDVLLRWQPGPAGDTPTPVSLHL